MTSSSGQAKATHPHRWGIAARAAIALMPVALLAFLPSSATAQYTLTFDGGTTAGNTMASNYQGSISTGVVLITNGFESNFGSGPFTGYANSSGDCNDDSTTPSAGLCFQNVGTSTTNYGGSPAAGNGAVAGTYCTSSGFGFCFGSNGGTGVGVFDFAAVGGRVSTFDSVTVGCNYSLATGNSTSLNCQNSTTVRLELQVWDAAGTTELAYFFDPAFGTSDHDALTLHRSDFTTIGSATLVNMSGGFRFQWGSVSGSSTLGTCGTSCPLSSSGSDVFLIDNLAFKTEIVPEPTTIALFGTGLLGLAPLLLRRRRRTV